MNNSGWNIKAARLAGLGSLLVLTLGVLPNQGLADHAWIVFSGRLHLFILHFPFGVLVTAALLEIFARRRPRGELSPVCQFVLIIAATCCVPAAVSGSLLALSGEYGEALLFRHRWAATATTVIVLWLPFLRSGPTRQAGGPPRIYEAALVVSLGSLVYAGHMGGTLTHGAVFMKLPWLQASTPLSSGADRVPRYETHIRPILKEYCVRCHGPEKSKGKLRLDSLAGIIEGGESGAIFLQGMPDKSLFVSSLELPLEDDDHMPPEGKPQPRPEDTALIREWVRTCTILE